MPWIDRLEKLGRLVLWFSISLLLVGVPLSYANQRREDAGLHESLRQTQAKLEEALRPKNPAVISIESVGPFMSSLNRTTATGHVWLTNASHRGGVICIHANALNRETQKSAASLAACQELAPYASNVQIAFQFAGGDLANVCGKAECSLIVVDEPIRDASK